MNTKYLVGFFLLGLIALTGFFFKGISSRVDYNKDVKPILNKHCISCHGGVKANGDFSLMTRETALKKTESGVYAIVPGNPGESEIIRRINAEDPEERMPLEKPALSNQEKSILKKWVSQGAPWDKHWSYQTISLPPADTGFIQLEKVSEKLDFFLEKSRKQHGFSLQSKAASSDLLRRINLAITGLPPSPEVQDWYLKGGVDVSTLIDTLLTHPAYGEKWATMWLDIARYADSKGFERDFSRNIWPYRDYVIKALNQDLPYDTFLIEQLAGDLLPDPTFDQLIATGFHRNTTTNDEGGTDNEEYRIRAVMDRVSTTWEGLMGTTMACVQCHGHPYDPFPQQDFYESLAFFNNTRDADTYADYPRLKILDSLESEKIREIKSWIEEKSNPLISEYFESFLLTGVPARYSIETDELIHADHYDTKWLGLRKYGSARLRNTLLSEADRLYLRMQSWMPGGILQMNKDSLKGPLVGKWNIPNTHGKYEIIDLPLYGFQGVHDVYFSYANKNLKDPDKRGISIDWFYLGKAFPGAGDKASIDIKKEYLALLNKDQNHTLIMAENPPHLHRKTQVYDRGNWLSPGQEVYPGVPEVLTPLSSDKNTSRLDFAFWMVDPAHPLTARTFVNRVWHELFGLGLVETTEDLGSQGSIPSHPELLDFLAYHWMHSLDWSIKDLIKAIILTNSYQQSAAASLHMLEKDSKNKWITRGPRKRLNAEEIRDQALLVSGLLKPKMYGPPVMPYQPDNIWQTPYNNQAWKMSEGDDRYRRAIYTFLKRSAVYPSFETFDLANRSVCTSRRIPTNTPLQALVTLNDPVYLEAAQALAQKMDIEGGSSLTEKISLGYKLLMAKAPSTSKLNILMKLYEESNPDLGEGISEKELHLHRLTIVANVLLNLDEVLTI